jgi:hypothetical protein
VEFFSQPKKFLKLLQVKTCQIKTKVIWPLQQTLNFPLNEAVLPLQTGKKASFPGKNKPPTLLSPIIYGSVAALKLL